MEKEIKEKKKYDQGTNIKFIKIFCKECKKESIIMSRAKDRLRCPYCEEMQNISKIKEVNGD